MAYVQKPGTGALWVNDRKTEDRHPDRTGTLVMPDGSEYFIDGWLKETKPDAQGKTKKFLSLSVKPKNRHAGQPAHAAGRQQPQRQPRTPISRPAPPARPAPPGRRAAPADPDLDEPMPEQHWT